VLHLKPHVGIFIEVYFVLNWHMVQEHDDQSGESHFDTDFYCDTCNRSFDTESEM
jgi:hypothetical protein